MTDVGKGRVQESRGSVALWKETDAGFVASKACMEIIEIDRGQKVQRRRIITVVLIFLLARGAKLIARWSVGGGLA